MSVPCSSSNKLIRIGLVEFDPMRIAGCESSLGHQSGAQLVPLSFAHLMRDHTIHLALLQWCRPFNEPATLTLLRSVHPRLKLIALGNFLDEESILTALIIGASGCLDDTSPLADLGLAIECVLRDKVWVPETVPDRLAKAGSRPAGKSVRITQREREILEHLVSAKSNREIAYTLNIEERTVKSHIARLLRKTGATNRIALSMRMAGHLPRQT